MTRAKKHLDVVVVVGVGAKAEKDTKRTADAGKRTSFLNNSSSSLSPHLLSLCRVSTVKANLKWLSYFTLS